MSCRQNSFSIYTSIQWMKLIEAIKRIEYVSLKYLRSQLYWGKKFPFLDDRHTIKYLNLHCLLSRFTDTMYTLLTTRGMKTNKNRIKIDQHLCNSSITQEDRSVRNDEFRNIPRCWERAEAQYDRDVINWMWKWKHF